MADLKLNTVAELASFFATHGSGPGNHPAKDVPLKRTAKLTAEEVKILNDYSVNVAADAWVRVTKENVSFLLGLEEATPADVIFATYGGKAYTAKRNRYNRKRTASRIGPVSKPKTYSNLMARLLWLSLRIDPFVYDWNGDIQSAQHRCDAWQLALLVAEQAITAEPIYIRIVVGNPPQFRDGMDKAKSRTKTNDDEVDATLFPRDLIDRVALQYTGVISEPKHYEKERSDLVKLRSKVCETVRNRLTGSDFSKTGSKFDSEQDEQISELLGTIELANFEQKDNEGNLVKTVAGGEFSLLEYVCCRLYEAQKSQSGKLDAPWTKTFSPAIVASTLILANVSEDVITTQLEEASALVDLSDMTVEERTNWMLAKRAELLDLENPIELNLDLFNTFVHSLTTSMATKEGGAGPFGTVFAEIASKRTTTKSTEENAKYLYHENSFVAMSACVQLVKHVVAGDDLDEIKVWTSYPKVGKGEAKAVSPVYRNFGGRDIGFVSKTKKKDE